VGGDLTYAQGPHVKYDRRVELAHVRAAGRAGADHPRTLTGDHGGSPITV